MKHVCKKNKESCDQYIISVGLFFFFFKSNVYALYCRGSAIRFQHGRRGINNHGFPNDNWFKTQIIIDALIWALADWYIMVASKCPVASFKSRLSFLLCNIFKVIFILAMIESSLTFLKVLIERDMFWTNHLNLHIEYIQFIHNLHNVHRLRRTDKVHVCCI